MNPKGEGGGGGYRNAQNITLEVFFKSTTLKTEKKCINLRVGFVGIEESFDTTFSLGYGGIWSSRKPGRFCLREKYLL